MIKNLEIYKLQNNCELKQLNEDISNLEKEIYELNSQNKKKLNYKKGNFNWIKQWIYNKIDEL